MSVQEIFHRITRLVKYLYDAIVFRLDRMAVRSSDLGESERNLFENVSIKTASHADIDPDILANARADWLENTVYLFDATSPFTLSSPIQWLTDPKTGTNTPRRFGRSIDYRDDQCVGEVKYLWELGRHQFLVPMAIHVASSDDAAVKAKLASHLSSWMEQNPAGMGIHWCSALEVSLRLISWSLVHSILQAGGLVKGLFSLDCNVTLLKSHIESQLGFVVGNYSRFSSSNNHLIGELTGVWVACNVFNAGKRGIRWRTSAFAELEREILLQTHSDGVNKEQAIYYHLWSMEYFWLSWLIAKRYEQVVSEGYEARLVAMYRFLRSMNQAADYPSQIGDADGGVVSRFDLKFPENPYRALLDSIDQILEGAPAAGGEPAGTLYSKPFWYRAMICEADVSSVTELMEGDKALSSSDSAFDVGGYFKLVGKNCTLLFKTGPFGYLSTGAHGHADALSVTLAIEGQWWLIDPGTYTYHSSGEWRNYFRSTAAHNTLCVNRMNQSKIGGDFLWSTQTDAQIERVEWRNDAPAPSLQAVAGSHSGYEDQGVEHQRTVSCDGQLTFQLDDLIQIESGAASSNLQLNFHFHPDIILKQLDTHRWQATRQNSSVVLTLSLPADFDWTVERGSVDPIAGWYSDTYGVKVPSNTLMGHFVINENRSDTACQSIFQTTLAIQRTDGNTPNPGEFQ